MKLGTFCRYGLTARFSTVTGKRTSCEIIDPLGGTIEESGGLDTKQEAVEWAQDIMSYYVQWIIIDGDFHVVENITEWGELSTIDTEEYGFYVARDSAEAGEAARECWEDMAKADPVEFRHMVGDATLVSWALGQSAGPGTTKVNSLDEWLDLHIDAPEEHFASYDGEERVVEGCSLALAEELGFRPTVAYRYT